MLKLKNELQKKSELKLAPVSELHSFSLGQDYTIPSWSGKPIYKYYFEVIKDGTIIEEIDLSKKPFYLIGKYGDLCDIVAQHPSVSRKHAVVQFKEKGEGVFIFDLGSAHGTKVNKVRVRPRTYYKLAPNNVIKFAESTRLYILRCPYLEEYKETGQVSQEALQDNLKLV